MDNKEKYKKKLSKEEEKGEKAKLSYEVNVECCLIREIGDNCFQVFPS